MNAILIWQTAIQTRDTYALHKKGVIRTYGVQAYTTKPFVFTPPLSLLATNHVTTVYECTYLTLHMNVCFRTIAHSPICPIGMQKSISKLSR